MLHWYHLSVLQNWTKMDVQIVGILELPGSLFRTLVLPLHLYLSYGSVPKHGDLPVEDAHWLDSELSLGFHLNHTPIYHMVRIMYISFKQRNMKNIMSSSASRQCNSRCNWTYSSKHFKWPTISWWRFGTTSKIQETLPCPHFEVNMIPNAELSMHSMLVYIAFLSILGYFHILPDLCNLLLDFLEKI